MTALKFHSLERYFFLLITVMNLAPVLLFKFFPTMDGAAHLYNSNLIVSLLFDNDHLLHDYFIFNSELVPNWMGHIILSFFNSFMPAFIAEKILLLLYFIGLPYSFRLLVKGLSPNGYMFSYFIFPFTYSFLFILGFYNFSLAIILFFITLNYWIKTEKDVLSIRKIITLFLLSTLTYFSHIFIFALLIYLLGLHIITSVIEEFMHKHIKNIGEVFSLMFKKSAAILISAFIPLSFFLYYFISRDANENYIYLEFNELIEGLKNIRYIIAYDTSSELVYTGKIFYTLIFISVIAVYKQISNTHLSQSYFWSITTVSILLLYFFVPDVIGNAGYVSIRLGLLFFMFLIVWLSKQHLSKWLILPGIAVILFCNFRLVTYYLPIINNLNKVAIECNNASENIYPGSVVLPINYSDKWIAIHFSNYLGIDKPMIILENYECGTGYFPILWNKEKMPQSLFGKYEQEKYECLYWFSNSNNPEIVVDYVFILGDIESKDDSCTNDIKLNLQEHYSLVERNDYCELFKKNTY